MIMAFVHRKTLLAAALVCCTAGPVSAAGFAADGADVEASAADERLDLLEACAAAQEYDATIRAMRARHEGVLEEVDKAEAGFMPSVNIAAVRGRNATESTSQGVFGPVEQERFYNSINYSISLRQPVLNFTTIAEFRKAKAMVARSEKELEEERSSLIIRVAEIYMNLLLSRDFLSYTEARIRAAVQTLAQARRSLELGYGRVTDVSEAEAELDMARAEALQASNDLEFQFNELKRLIGFMPAGVYSLVPSRMELSVPGARSLQEWMDKAIASAPMVQRAREEVRIARREREKNKAAGYPVINLNASRTYSESDDNYSIGNTYDTYSLNLQLSMPLYSGGYISSSVRQASAGIIEAEERLKETERKIRSEVRKYYNALVDAIGKIHAYEKAVGSAKVAYEGARKAYEHDHGTVVEIEKAKERVLHARYQLSNIRYEFILNRLVLKHFSGSLSAKDVDEVNGWLGVPFSE